MLTNEQKQEIVDFLKSPNATPEQAIALWNRYGNHAGHDKAFNRSPVVNYHKIRYELAKEAGISVANFTAGIYVVEQSAVGVAAVAPSPRLVSPNAITIPELVDRIKREYQELTEQDNMLQKQLAELGDDNSADAQQKAAAILAERSTINARRDVLYNAKEDYFVKKIIPNAAELFPELAPKPSAFDKIADMVGLGGMVMMRRKTNLESSLAKDRNLLRYQSKTKLDTENPMPNGPERTAIEKRIDEKQAELNAINEKIRNAG